MDTTYLVWVLQPTSGLLFIDLPPRTFCKVGVGAGEGIRVAVVHRTRYDGVSDKGTTPNLNPNLTPNSNHAPYSGIGRALSVHGPVAPGRKV